ALAPEYHVRMPPGIFVRFVALILFAGSIFAQPAPSPQPAASPATVTATFWNVQWFPGRRPNASGGDENRQIRAVHDDIALLHSDVVAVVDIRDYHDAAFAVNPPAR